MPNDPPNKIISPTAPLKLSSLGEQRLGRAQLILMPTETHINSPKQKGNKTIADKHPKQLGAELRLSGVGST
jgi:hypothetical protein